MAFRYRDSGKFTYCGGLPTRSCSSVASRNYTYDYHRSADVGSGQCFLTARAWDAKSFVRLQLLSDNEDVLLLRKTQRFARRTTALSYTKLQPLNLKSAYRYSRSTRLWWASKPSRSSNVCERR